MLVAKCYFRNGVPKLLPLVFGILQGLFPKIGQGKISFALSSSDFCGLPKFGNQIKAFNKQRVILEGYFIPVDTEGNFHILSKFPFSSCFFCGAAGPESVVEIQLDKKIAKGLKTDAQLRVQGKLVLNRADFDHCNYILEDVKLLSKK